MANITVVTKGNVDAEGFFCFMSQKKKPGYSQKLQWLKERFDEGLVIKKLDLPERGFIEYIPGEFAWRSINAKDFMFIHCLWVVGKSKGKGFAKELINTCEQDAKEKGFKGIAVVTSEGNWLVNKKIFVESGYSVVGEITPFSLLIKKFDETTKSPSFCGGYEEKAKAFGKGLSVIRTNQCPYNEDATEIYENFAKKHKLEFNIVTLQTAEEVREKSPSIYGTFAVVFNGNLVTYSYLKDSQLEKIFKDNSWL